MPESKSRKKKSKNLTANKKRSGREFEEMITRIEAIALKNNAVIKSPDRIIDKETGRTREIDATIRSKVGSAEVLVIIECRDRSRKQDVRWIEEVYGKGISVGANLIVAVSSKGFSDEAKKKAQARGIKLRTTRNVDADSVYSWLQFSEFGYRYDPTDMKVVCLVPEENKDIYEVEFKEINSLGMLDVDNFINGINNQSMTLRPMFEYLINHFRLLLNEKVKPKDTVNFTLNYSKQPKIRLRLPTGEYEVEEISIDFTFSEHWETLLKPERAVIYSDEVGDLINAAEYKVNLPESSEPKLITVHHNKTTGELATSVWGLTNSSEK